MIAVNKTAENMIGAYVFDLSLSQGQLICFVSYLYLQTIHWGVS